MHNLLKRICDVRHGSVANLGAGTCASPISNQVPDIDCYVLVNVEIFKPYVVMLDRIRWTAKTARNVEQDIISWIKTQHDKSFDVVLLIDVLEHFDWDLGDYVLSQALRIASKQVLIWMPFGNCPQEAYDGNVYQKHLSVWKEEDFAGATTIEVFRGAHTHINPPCDAAWISYLMEVGNGTD